jgi:hypothetical protein
MNCLCEMNALLKGIWWCIENWCWLFTDGICNPLNDFDWGAS